MKKFLLPVLFVLCFTVVSSQVSTSLAAGKPLNETVVVPTAAHNKYLAENPEIKANWKKAGDYYNAEYINPINNMGYIIVYDQNGTVMRREKELEPQESPAIIHDFYNRNFPGEGYVIWSSTDSAGNVSYYSPHNTEIHRFDKDGNFISTKKGKLRSSDSLSPVINR